MNLPRLLHLFIVSIFCITPVISFAGESENQLLQQGNEAYSRKAYDQAIARYEELTDRAGFSASVLFNLANSYAQTGKIGLAVLNYERALRLDPGDSDISGNLELVRKESGLFAGEFSGAERFFRILELNRWTQLILLGLILFTLFRLVGLRYRFSGKVGGVIASACLLLLCLGVAGTVYRSRYFNPAVVIAPDARMLISPFASAASIGAIQEGRLVFPEKEHGDFAYVTDETRRKGWIPRNSIIPVID